MNQSASQLISGASDLTQTTRCTIDLMVIKECIDGKWHTTVNMNVPELGINNYMRGPDLQEALKAFVDDYMKKHWEE